MNRDTPTEQPALLTIAAAARYLGLSRSSVYRLIGRGALPIVRPLPDAPRIARADLEQYADALRAAA